MLNEYEITTNKCNQNSWDYSFLVGSILEVISHGFKFGGNDSFNLFNNSDFGGSGFLVFSPFGSPFFTLGLFGGFFVSASKDVGNGFFVNSLL